MKHQISRVVTIAALALIGIGFAGTQQANATPCKPDVCEHWESPKCLTLDKKGKPIYKGGSTGNFEYKDVEYRNSSTPLDCTGYCTKYTVTVTIIYFRCCRTFRNGKVVPGSRSKDTKYDTFVS